MKQISLSLTAVNWKNNFIEAYDTKDSYRGVAKIFQTRGGEGGSHGAKTRFPTRF